MQQYKVKRQVFGYDIKACITKMDGDIHILLTGGSLPHTGAVSIFEKGKEVGFIQLPGHKDGVVGSRWAKELSEIFPYRVTVVCGIHYDNASGGMIQEIVEQTSDMLQEVIKNLG
jgi:gallate decarboxylase subunit D